MKHFPNKNVIPVFPLCWVVDYGLKFDMRIYRESLCLPNFESLEKIKETWLCPLSKDSVLGTKKVDLSSAMCCRGNFAGRPAQKTFTTRDL